MPNKKDIEKRIEKILRKHGLHGADNWRAAEDIAKELSSQRKEIRKRYEKRLRDIKDLDEAYDNKIRKEIIEEVLSIMTDFIEECADKMNGKKGLRHYVPTERLKEVKEKYIKNMPDYLSKLKKAGELR